MLLYRKGLRYMFNYNKFRNLRKKNNLLQSDIAEKLNVSTSTIGMWEQGRNQPDNESLIKIANLFNVSTDYLLGIDKTSSLDLSGLNEREIMLVYELVEYFKSSKRA